MDKIFTRIVSGLAGLYMFGTGLHDLVTLTTAGTMTSHFRHGADRTLYWPDDETAILLFLAVYLLLGGICLWSTLVPSKRGD